MTLSRRSLLAQASILPLSAHAFAASAATPGRLIVVFLRGAIDGLNVVVPYGDHDYAIARPTIAIAPPGAAGGGTPTNSRRRHPRLPPATLRQSTRR